MLLRHVVQHHKSICWRGIPIARCSMSSSTKVPNSKPSIRESEKRKKEAGASESIQTISTANNIKRNGQANGENIWSRLGKEAEESEPLPQACDSSWKGTEKGSKREYGPKAGVHLPSFFRRHADQYTELCNDSYRTYMRCTETLFIPQDSCPGSTIPSIHRPLPRRRPRKNSSIISSRCAMLSQ